MCRTSQRLRCRDHSQTHAASGFVGSASFGFHCCQPHEKTEPSRSSLATSFADSAYHFTTWSHAESGSRPLRPPPPFWERTLTMIPSRLAGMPIARNGATAARYRSRSTRLPSTGPSFHTGVAGT